MGTPPTPPSTHDEAGTNIYHGSVYEQHREQRWNATPHFVRLAFDEDVRRGRTKAGDQKQPSGATASWVDLLNRLNW